VIAYFVIGLVVLAIGFGVLASTRWAGRRGWVYNKHNPRPSGAGYAAGVFEEVFQPGIEHVVDERQSERLRADQDESGDDVI
jgi:hypothetical protein